MHVSLNSEAHTIYDEYAVNQLRVTVHEHFESRL